MMTVEQIEEALDITYTVLRSIKETLTVQGKNIKLNNDVAVIQQKMIVDLDKQVKALLQNTHTHSVVYGYMQKSCMVCGKSEGHGGLQCPNLKPDAFDTTGVVE